MGSRSKENKQESERGTERENKNTEEMERRNKWSNRRKDGRKE